MNTTAEAFLRLVNGARTLRTISKLLAEQYNQPEERVLYDILVLSNQLQNNHLLNFKMNWFEMIFGWLIALIHFMPLPILSWRYDIYKTKSFSLIFINILPVVLCTLMPILLVSGVLVMVFATLLQVVLIVLEIYVLLCAFVIVSIALHETGHLWAVRQKRGDAIGFLVASPLYIRVIRPREMVVKDEAFISLSGPVTPLLISIPLLCYHLYQPVWINWIVISIFALHGLQLVLPNRDLKNIFEVVNKHHTKKVDQEVDQHSLGGEDMSALIRSLFIGIIITILAAILTVVGVLGYGLTNAPQQIDVTIATWDILSFTAASDGGFSLKIMGKFPIAVAAMCATIASVSFLIHILFRRNRRNSIPA